MFYFADVKYSRIFHEKLYKKVSLPTVKILRDVKKKKIVIGLLGLMIIVSSFVVYAYLHCMDKNC